jgi:class 3 adenylate cyclase
LKYQSVSEVADPDPTFLFADLVGFTALTEAEGDHRAVEVATALQSRIRSLLPRFNAQEVKSLGDALMLLSPTPADGVRLGLRIVSEVDSDPDLPPIRVGVHCGPAVERRGDWYGRTVNVAARLCSAAAGGQVLVSEQALRAAGSMPEVELGKRRLHWLRNVTEPIAARLATERQSLARLTGTATLLPASLAGRLVS